MDIIHAAVIGVGHLGRHHARIYSDIAGIELAGVNDANPVRAEMIAREFNTKAVSSIDALAEMSDIISIAVPTTAHCEIGVKCIDLGCHVLVEKPIASTLLEAQELIDAAERNKKILQVGHTERYNGAVFALGKYIHDPRFMEIHRIGPFAARSLDIDVVLDLMIHDIDIVLSLVPHELVSVSSAGVPVLTSKIDIVNARMVFKNGCIANMTASRISKEVLRKLRVFQKGSYLSLNYEKQELTRAYLTKQPVIDIKQLQSCIKSEIVPVQKQEPLKAELAGFIEAVKENRQPMVTGADGKKALEVALLVVSQIEN